MTLPIQEYKAYRETLTKLTLWIFEVDNFIDSGRYTQTEIEKIILSTMMVFGNKEITIDLPTIELRNNLCTFNDVVTEIKRCKGYSVFDHTFSKNLQLMLEGMLYENTSQNFSIPLANYLQKAQYSIGVPLVSTTLAILLNDRDITQDWVSIDKISQNMYKAIRLANDLRTYEGERGGINSINILEAKNHNNKKVRRFLQSEIDSYYKTYFSLVETKTQNSMVFFSRLYDISLKLYEFSFIRDLTPQELNRLEAHL